MKLNELLEKYYFHDSGYNGIVYNSATHNAIIEVDFCNWMQDYFKEGQEQNLIIRLVFSGISSIEYEGLEKADPADEILDQNILTDDEGLFGLDFGVYKGNLEPRHIRIFAEDVEFVVVGPRGY